MVAQELQDKIEAESTAKLLSFLILVAAYIGLCSALNVLNRWALGVYGFKFPFLLTACHMLFSFMVLAPVAMRQPWHVHRRTLQKQWKGLLNIGAFMALNIVLNNASLTGISLTLNQIIRSATPVVTCLIAMVVENHFPTRQEAWSLVVLTSGVMLAVWQGTVAGEPFAIMFCIASVVSAGAMMSLSARLMSEKLDVVRLTFYTAPISLLCLIPPLYYYERDAFFAYLPHHYDGVIFIIAVSSVLAVAYNLVHSKMIKETSAVTTTVLGEVKIIGLLVLSAMVLGESREFTFKMTAGCALSLFGFGMYSHTKIQKLRIQLPAPVIHVNTTANGTTPIPTLIPARDLPTKPVRFDDEERPTLTVIKL